MGTAGGSGGQTSASSLLFASGAASLTAGQRHVIVEVGEADSLGEAALRLGVSPSALTAKLRAIANRLGLADRDDLVALARQRRVLDACPEAIVAVTRDGRCVVANRQAAHSLGYAVEELAGANLHELVHHSWPDGSPMLLEECSLRRIVQSGAPQRGVQEVFWHRDGSPVWVSCAVDPVSSEGGGTAALVSFQDIGELVEARQARSLSDAGLDLAMEATGLAAFSVDLVSGVVVRSENLATVLGVDPSALSTPSSVDEIFAFVHPDDRHLIDLGRARRLPTGLLVDEVLRFRVPGGERRIRARMRVIGDEAGRSNALLGVLIDVSEAEHAAEAHRQLIDMSTSAFVGADENGLIAEWNLAAERIFGWSRADVLGRPMAELLIPERYRAAHLRAVSRLLDHDAPASVAREPIELEALRADGSEIPVEISVNALRVGTGMVMRAFVRDISARKAMERALLDHAVVDDLTGLPNRALLLDRVARAIGRLRDAEPAPLALLVVDIDRFNVLNDGLGHGAGDELLVEVARRVRLEVPPVQTVARVGGDELAVVHEAMTEAEARALAEVLRAAVALPLVVRGRELAVSISVGIVVTRDAAAAPDDLLRDATAAMYLAKQRGRGRTEVFQRAMRDTVVTRLDLESGLQRAAELGELAVHHQPIIDLRTGSVTGVEALARWNHPTLGAVPPGAFIPLAEETGLIVPLGSWILETACEHARAWDASGHAPVGLAVNVAARQLVEPGFVDSVTGILRRTGVEGTRLQVEVTETALLADPALVAGVLRDLGELGVHAALDDFGTGYSSFLYLRDFPIEVVKLDRSFIAGLGRDDRDTAIVSAVIDLAHALGMVAVAEGIERPEQAEQLVAMGCDLGQGHLWSPAVPSDEVGRLLPASA